MRHPTVDALDHPRVAVAHRYTDEVRLDAAEAQPGAVRAAEVVGRRSRELGSLARLHEIPPNGAPGPEKRPVPAFSEALSVFQERLAPGDDGYHAGGVFGLGAPEED